MTPERIAEIKRVSQRRGMFTGGYICDLEECLSEIERLQIENDRLAAFALFDADCPCCGETKQCLDGCTFAKDCPNELERMKGARYALYGHD